MIRIAHVSDIHVTASPLGLRGRDFLTKRLGTWFNMRFHRGQKFRRADAVLAALEADRRQRGIEYVIFSGDATNFGLPNEIRRASALLGVGRVPGLAVPGNHDYLTRAAQADGEFERSFAPWQTGERIDGHVYPFAQNLGGVWFVALNSARANRWIWDASGGVGPEQAQRLDRLLTALPPGPRVLVTHYPVSLKNGRPELRARGLDDLAAVLEIARRGGVRCWLHGHRHHFYHLPNPLGAGIPVVCIGSSTQEGRWSYGDYTITPQKLSATRRVYRPDENHFADAESLAINLI